MMSFYTGREAKLYDKRYKKIVKYLLDTSEIKARNPKKANSEAFRWMVNKVYFWILNNKIETKIENEK